jgi:hypothetical protein
LSSPTPWIDDPRMPVEKEVWEIHNQTQSTRIWKLVDANAYYRSDVKSVAGLLIDYPYILKEDDWEARQRTWQDGITRMEVKELYATDKGGQFSAEALIRGKDIQILMDSGAEGNFMSKETANRLNMPLKMLDRPYRLKVVDGTNINYQDGLVTQVTVPTQVMTNEGHASEVQFDIAPTGGHEAILGMPWFEEHNPEVDWQARTLRFSRCHCIGSQ